MDNLISRQTAIDALKICDNNEEGKNCRNCPMRDERWNGAWEDDETNCWTKLMRDSAKLLELLSAQLEQGWIPCSEWLPFAEYGESQKVYCYCHDVNRGGKWAEMLYFNGGVWCKPTGETFDYKVLAWYPLPKKPYREEGDE